MVENNKFDEFIEEVEQDIRQEKLISLWNKYGKMVTYTATALVITVAGASLWDQHKTRQKNLISDQLMMAHTLLLEDKTNEAIGVLKNIEDQASHNIYKGFSSFLLAAVQAERNKNSQEAIALYEKIERSSQVPDFLKDLATINRIRLSIDISSSKISQQEATKWIESLDHIKGDSHTWSYLAKEMKAFIHYQAQHYKKSQEIYSDLVRDSKTPKDLRNRASLMVQVINTSLS